MWFRVDQFIHVFMIQVNYGFHTFFKKIEHGQISHLEWCFMQPCTGRIIAPQFPFLPKHKYNDLETVGCLTGCLFINMHFEAS